MNRRFCTEDISDIAAICGEAVALELLASLPGVEIKVPLRWSPDNPLSRLKRETADTIIREFPGNKFYVPTRAERIDTRAAVRRLSAQGKAAIEIALSLHVSERYVRILLAGSRAPRGRCKADDRQLDLVDWIDEQGRTA